MRRGGMVLAAVLVVVAVAAMVAAGLLFRMTAEVSATAAVSRSQQAYAAAMSGLQQAIAVLQAHGQDSTYWHDEPALFRNQFVCDDGANCWYFTIYAPGGDGQESLRYGLSDENGKINLNAATEEVLLRLPNMTQELVDCLLDYRDEDSQTRPQGAEQDYYDTLGKPYAMRNGPFETLDELLLVKGFNAAIVYGEDANQNCLLEPNEDDGQESFPPDDRDGRLNQGLRGVATVMSHEPPQLERERMKVDLNAPGDIYQRLSETGLPAETVEFIMLCRQDGYRFTHPSELLEMQYQLRSDPSGGQGGQGGQTGQPPGRGGRGRGGAASSWRYQGSAKAGDRIESGVDGDVLPIVMERLTVRAAAGRSRVSLVNVNTACEAVLSALPGMDADSARSAVDIRGALAAETKANLAWLYTHGALNAQAFKAVAPYLTTQSFQFHLRCVGFGSPAGQYRIIEAVVDMGGASPAVVYLRDITGLALPFALDPEERET